MTHGPACKHCRKTEARCAYNSGCCSRCTHDFNAPRCRLRSTTVCRISSGPAPWVAQCLGCGEITMQQPLISAAVADLAKSHGYSSIFERLAVAS